MASRSLTLLAALVVCACGSADPPPTAPPAPTAATAPTSAPAPSADLAPVALAATTSAPPVGPGAPLAFGPMKLILPKKNHNVELKADGKLYVDAKPVAVFSGPELQDTSGHTLASVASDDSVTGFFFGKDEHVRFNDKDELVSDDGSRFAIAEDGTATTLFKGGKPSSLGTFKVVGLKPNQRRAAALVLFMGVAAEAVDQMHASAKANKPH